jgi:choline-sulfatase
MNRQLFDLTDDPGELCNLAARAGNDMAEALRARVQRSWSLESVHAQVLASQRRRLLVAAALRLGQQTSWDYQPRFDASEQYVRNNKSLEELEAAARFPRFSPG